MAARPRRPRRCLRRTSPRSRQRRGARESQARDRACGQEPSRQTAPTGAASADAPEARETACFSRRARGERTCAGDDAEEAGAAPEDVAEETGIDRSATEAKLTAEVSLRPPTAPRRAADGKAAPAPRRHGCARARRREGERDSRGRRAGRDEAPAAAAGGRPGRTRGPFASRGNFRGASAADAGGDSGRDVRERSRAGAGGLHPPPPPGGGQSGWLPRGRGARAKRRRQDACLPRRSRGGAGGHDGAVRRKAARTGGKHNGGTGSRQALNHLGLPVDGSFDILSLQGRDYKRGFRDCPDR